MMESPTNLKNPSLKRTMFELIATPTQSYNQHVATVASLLHLLHKFEHLPPVITELLAVLANDYGNVKVSGDILRCFHPPLLLGCHPRNPHP